MDALRAKQQAAKALQATNTPPPPPKQQIEPNTAQEIDRKRQLLQDFDKGMSEKAEEIHKHELKELRDKAKPMLQEINKLRDNKPLNPFKTKAWKQDLDKNLEQYNKLKQHMTPNSKKELPQSIRKWLERFITKLSLINMTSYTRYKMTLNHTINSENSKSYSNGKPS